MLLESEMLDTSHKSQDSREVRVNEFIRGLNYEHESER